jgi:hypothetical protein
MPVPASPIAMFMFPPMAAHTTLPLTSWSWPSIVTLVPPLGAAVALADPVSEAAEVSELSALGELSDDFLSSDEQPDRLAMTIAAPPTATSNPRFTTSPFGNRDRSRSTDRPEYYGVLVGPGHEFA